MKSSQNHQVSLILFLVVLRILDCKGVSKNQSVNSSMQDSLQSMWKTIKVYRRIGCWSTPCSDYRTTCDDE